MLLEKIDHIGVAVRDLDTSLKMYRDVLCLEVKMVEVLDDFKVRIAFIPIGEAMIELLESTDPKGFIAKFIEERGEGVNHIAYRTKDIDEALRRLKRMGVKLRDEKPRIGGAGSKIAFVEPESMNGVLVELVERKSEIH